MLYNSNADLPAPVRNALSESEQVQYRAICNKAAEDGKNIAEGFLTANGILTGIKQRGASDLVGDIRELVAADGKKSYQYVDSWDYSARAYSQDEAGYSPVGGTNTTACSNCRWFVGPSRCAIVGGEIAPNGLSGFWAAVPKYEMAPMPVYIVKDAKESGDGSLLGAIDEKSLLERLSAKVMESVKSLLSGAKPDAPVHGGKERSGLRAFTCYKDAESGRYRFMATMTNNFVDRDGETFTEESHKDYVDWAETTGDYPELWLWHTPGSKFGKADWLDYHSGFVVASGWIDEGKEYIAEKLASNEEEIGVSHGFVCLKTNDGTIVKYRSYELSPLPLASAANEWTSFNLLSVKESDMAFSQKRREHLVGLVGEETVKSWETNTETMGATLKTLGVEFKSRMETDPADGAGAGAAEGTLVDPTTAAVLANEVVALTKALTETSAVVAGFKTQLAAVEVAAKKSREDILSEELQARTAGLPQGYRASQSDASVAGVGAGEKAAAQTAKDVDWFNSAVIGPIVGGSPTSV